MECKHCGAIIPKEDKYCSYCGSPVESKVNKKNDTKSKYDDGKWSKSYNFSFFKSFTKIKDNSNLDTAGVLRILSYILIIPVVFLLLILILHNPLPNDAPLYERQDIIKMKLNLYSLVLTIITFGLIVFRASSNLIKNYIDKASAKSSNTNDSKKSFSNKIECFKNKIDAKLKSSEGKKRNLIKNFSIALLLLGITTIILTFVLSNIIHLETSRIDANTIYLLGLISITLGYILAFLGVYMLVKIADKISYSINIK